MMLEPEQEPADSCLFGMEIVATTYTGLLEIQQWKNTNTDAKVEQS